MDEDWIIAGVVLLIIGICLFLYGYNGVQEFQTEMGQTALAFGGKEAYRMYERYNIEEMSGAAVGIGGLVLTIYGFMANKRHELSTPITIHGFMANKRHELSTPIEESNGNRSMRTSNRLGVNELKRMKLFEFQNWVCGKLGGRVSEKEDWMIGIDGWIVDEWKMRTNGLNTNKIPIQVKQSENISRNVVDSFETAIKKVKKDRGMIVAFSFDGGAYEEVARARLEDGLDIELKTVDEILERH